MKLLDDDNDSAANSAAVAEIEKEAAQDPDAPEVVDLAEKDETPEERETRLDKKAGRWRRHTQQTEEAEQRATALAEQNRILTENIQRQTDIAARMAANLERQMPKEKTAFDVRKEQAERDRDSLQASWNTLTAEQKQERHDEFVKRANNVDQELRVIAAEEVQSRQPRVNVTEQAEAAATNAMIASQHGDVWYNPAAKARSQVIYQDLVRPASQGGQGKQSNWMTLAEAMDKTREEFNIPTARSQQREATRRNRTPHHNRNDFSRWRKLRRRAASASLPLWRGCSSPRWFPRASGRALRIAPE